MPYPQERTKVNPLELPPPTDMPPPTDGLPSTDMPPPLMCPPHEMSHCPPTCQPPMRCDTPRHSTWWWRQRSTLAVGVKSLVLLFSRVRVLGGRCTSEAAWSAHNGKHFRFVSAATPESESCQLNSLPVSKKREKLDKAAVGVNRELHQIKQIKLILEICFWRVALKEARSKEANFPKKKIWSWKFLWWDSISFSGDGHRRAGPPQSQNLQNQELIYLLQQYIKTETACIEVFSGLWEMVPPATGVKSGLIVNLGFWVILEATPVVPPFFVISNLNWNEKWQQSHKILE